MKQKLENEGELRAAVAEAQKLARQDRAPYYVWRTRDRHGTPSYVVTSGYDQRPCGGKIKGMASVTGQYLEGER